MFFGPFTTLTSEKVAAPIVGFARAAMIAAARKNEEDVRDGPKMSGLKGLLPKSKYLTNKGLRCSRFASINLLS